MVPLASALSACMEVCTDEFFSWPWERFLTQNFGES